MSKKTVAIEFCKVVKALAKKSNVNYFVVTDEGVADWSNNGNEEVQSVIDMYRAEFMADLEEI